MFFPPLSFIFFAFFLFLLWHGSLWCNWMESSVQDSQWKTALTVIGGQTFSASYDPFLLATALISTMLAAVLSQRVVLQGHKEKRGKRYDHMRQMHFFTFLFFPFIKQTYFPCSIRRPAILLHLKMYSKCEDWRALSSDYLDICTSSLLGFHYPDPIKLHRCRACLWINGSSLLDYG